MQKYLLLLAINFPALYNSLTNSNISFDKLIKTFYNVDVLIIRQKCIKYRSSKNSNYTKHQLIVIDDIKIIIHYSFDMRIMKIILFYCNSIMLNPVLHQFRSIFCLYIQFFIDLTMVAGNVCISYKALGIKIFVLYI